MNEKSKKATSGKIKLIKIYSMLHNPISNNLPPLLSSNVLPSFINFKNKIIKKKGKLSRTLILLSGKFYDCFMISS